MKLKTLSQRQKTEFYRSLYFPELNAPNFCKKKELIFVNAQQQEKVSLDMVLSSISWNSESDSKASSELRILCFVNKASIIL